MTRGFQVHSSLRFRNRSIPLKLMSGSGASILLRKGGAGSASSYDGLQQYKEITGMGLGMGIGCGLAGSALSNLQPRMGRKPKNIAF
jgi:hypothetical protein